MAPYRATRSDPKDGFAPGLGFRPRGILGLSHEVVAASLGYKKGPRLGEKMYLVSTFVRTSRGFILRVLEMYSLLFM